jgi:hypothetical protein
MTHARIDLHPDLESLITEAGDRGWVRDASKGAPPARWVTVDETQQLTVVGFDTDFRTAVITVDAVRAFLGWDDTQENR